MAEFCVECWNKINETCDSKKKFILSDDLETCEECGELKHVIIRVRKRYILAYNITEIVENLRHSFNLNKK